MSVDLWKQRLSTDLLRIGHWLQQGDSEYSRKFLSIILKKYPINYSEVYGGKTMSAWFAVINHRDANRSAESALTLSRLLL